MPLYVGRYFCYLNSDVSNLELTFSSLGLGSLTSTTTSSEDRIDRLTEAQALLLALELNTGLAYLFLSTVQVELKSKHSLQTIDI